MLYFNSFEKKAKNNPSYDFISKEVKTKKKEKKIVKDIDDKFLKGYKEFYECRAKHCQSLVDKYNKDLNVYFRKKNDNILKNLKLMKAYKKKNKIINRPTKKQQNEMNRLYIENFKEFEKKEKALFDRIDNNHKELMKCLKTNCPNTDELIEKFNKMDPLERMNITDN